MDENVPQSPLDRALECVGGPTKLASLLGIGQSVVSNWRARGGDVPVAHCAAVEAVTSGAVRRWHLRPEDWHRIWPELIGADGAPAAPVEGPTSQPGALDEAEV